MFNIETALEDIRQLVAYDKFHVLYQVKKLDIDMDTLSHAIYTNNLNERNDTLELMRETIHTLINMLEPEEKTEDN